MLGEPDKFVWFALGLSVGQVMGFMIMLGALWATGGFRGPDGHS